MLTLNDQEIQAVVDLEADRLLRLTPCELMQIQSHDLVRVVADREVCVHVSVLDLGDVRHVGVSADRKFLLGRTKYARGIKVQLSARGMDAKETAEHYD